MRLFFSFLMGSALFTHTINKLNWCIMQANSSIEKGKFFVVLGAKGTPICRLPFMSLV